MYLMTKSLQLGLAAAIALAACSAAPAQSNESIAPDAGDLFRCFAHRAFIKEQTVGIFPKTSSIRGTMNFHSVTPDEKWASGAKVVLTSLAVDPDGTSGNGILAAISKSDPDRIQVYVTIDGTERPLATYRIGEPVPFKVSFDDAQGTVTVESGAKVVTAKPERLLRPTMNLSCVGADVSFRDIDTQP